MKKKMRTGGRKENKKKKEERGRRKKKSKKQAKLWRKEKKERKEKRNYKIMENVQRIKSCDTRNIHSLLTEILYIVCHTWSIDFYYKYF